MSVRRLQERICCALRTGAKLRRRSAAATDRVRAWRVMSNSSWLFRACKIVDGYFRQLERLVRRLPHFLFDKI